MHKLMDLFNDSVRPGTRQQRLLNGNYDGTEKHPLGYNQVQYKALSATLLCQACTQPEHKVALKTMRCAIFTALRMFTLGVAFATSLAYADDYSNVSQLLRAGKFNEALVKADSFLAANPRDPQMRFLKGVSQGYSGKKSEAINTFAQLTEDYPELPEPYNNLAVLLAAQNQFDQARSALESAIRANPEYATAHENLGDVYAKLAALSYGKSLQLDPAHSSAAPKLALIRQLLAPASRPPKSP